MRVCLITGPFINQVGHSAHWVLLTPFIRILQPLSSKIFLIATSFHPIDKLDNQKISFIRVSYSSPSKSSSFVRAIRFIGYQVRVSREIMRLSKQIDLVLIRGGQPLLLPTIMSRILRKKVYISCTGSISNMVRMVYPQPVGMIFAYIIKVICKINWRLADRIIVASKSEIEFEGMQGLERKISTNGTLFVDVDKFNIQKELYERANTIGFISSLKRYKGIMEFVKSISLIQSFDAGIDFLIGGHGELSNTIRDYLKESDMIDRVELTGWIPHDELPRYLNRLRLLILPSYTEQFGQIILEAMACGTPVLATPVGGIPDIIEDGQTGFIMEDNSPECIAKNVIRALNEPNLTTIVRNARLLIESEYSYEAVVNKYRRIFDNPRELP